MPRRNEDDQLSYPDDWTSLKELRFLRNYSQKQLAKKLKVQPSTYRTVENKNTVCRPRTRRKLARELNVTQSDMARFFLDRKEQKEKNKEELNNES